MGAGINAEYMGTRFQIETIKMKLFVVLCLLGVALAIPNPFADKMPMERPTGLVIPDEYYGKGYSKGYSPSYYNKGYSRGYAPCYHRRYVPCCAPTYHPRRVIRRRTCCYRRRYNKGCYSPVFYHC